MGAGEGLLLVRVLKLSKDNISEIAKHNIVVMTELPAPAGWNLAPRRPLVPVMN